MAGYHGAKYMFFFSLKKFVQMYRTYNSSLRLIGCMPTK